MSSLGVPARRLAVVGSIAVLTCAVPLPALGQTSASVAAARQLAAALDAAKLDSIAAVDPSEPGRFVAALYFPGTQLLVVSAKYAAPPLLLDKINNRDYRDIYIDLNAASVAGSKVFVIDQNADGLVMRPDDNQAPDNYENGERQIAFDGEWRKAKMSEDEYAKVFASADERYTHILNLLAAQARGGGS